MPEKYSKEQIQEIYNIFSNDDLYSMMSNTFYNGASKKQRVDLHNLRAAILNTCTGLLSSGQRSIESPELTASLTQFRKNATSDITAASIRKSEQKHLAKATRNLLSLSDGFANVYKYNAPDSFASSQVASASPQTRATFKKLTAYSALAKKTLALAEGKSYVYSKQENDAIAEVFQKQEPPVGDLKTIYSELSSAYDTATKADFVRSASKTKYLKNAGIHIKQILLSTGIALGVTTLFGAAALGGIPSDDPNAQAILNFLGSQVLPLAAPALAATTATIAADRAIVRGGFAKVREHIRDHVKDKNLFFALLNQSQPVKNEKSKKIKGKELDAAIEKFEKALKDNQERIFESKEFDINLGRNKFEKRKNYLILLEAENYIDSRTRNPGAPLFATTKRKWYEKKKFNLPNITTTLEYNDRISTNLSTKNPACQILGIQGTKVKPKTSRTTGSTKPVRTNIPMNQPSPILAITTDQEESNDRTPLNEEKQFNEVREVLSDSSIKGETLEVKINGATLEMEIQKNKAKQSSKDLEELLAKIKMKSAKMAASGVLDKPTTLTQGKDAISVKITLKEKPKTKK